MICLSYYVAAVDRLSIYLIAVLETQIDSGVVLTVEDCSCHLLNVSMQFKQHIFEIENRPLVIKERQPTFLYQICTQIKYNISALPESVSANISIYMHDTRDRLVMLDVVTRHT